MVMSGKHEGGIRQCVPERAIDEHVSTAFAHRQDRMVHHDYDEASVGFVHRVPQPCEGARQMDESNERVGIDADEANSRQVFIITGSGHTYRSVMRMRESMLPDGREGLVNALGILMIAGRNDDRQAVEPAIGPLAQQELVVIVLSAFHPVTHLRHCVRLRHTRRESVIVRPRELAVDIT